MDQLTERGIIQIPLRHAGKELVEFFRTAGIEEFLRGLISNPVEVEMSIKVDQDPILDSSLLPDVVSVIVVFHHADIRNRF